MRIRLIGDTRARSGRQPVVLLGDHDGFVMQVVQSLATTRRYRTVALSSSRATAVRYSRLCVHAQGDWSWDRGTEQLDPLARRMRGAILFPVTLDAVRWASRYRAQLARSWQLPLLPDPDVLDVVSDKAALADRIAREGGEIPAFRALTRGRATVLGDLTYPVLLKPRRQTGGVGIERLDTPAALRRRLEGLDVVDDYFVQTFVPGHDLSCGVLGRDGRVLAAVVYEGLARHGEFGSFTSIRVVDDPSALATVQDLMRRVRWTGLANVDLRRADDGRTYVLEVNPRMWGNALALLAAGVNFADLVCRSALGADLQLVAGAPNARYFAARDAIAAWRDRLLGRRRRDAGVAWRESALRFFVRDPLPYWVMYRAREGQHRPFAILQTLAHQRAPDGLRCV
jgi:predicted ATP-grasp superfamily ATP-dependent carboligase